MIKFRRLLNQERKFDALIRVATYLLLNKEKKSFLALINVVKDLILNSKRCLSRLQSNIALNSQY